ncbi:hypothetical protein [Rheinheimera sp.]|uniref:hypothetical protein n=1 Tax=Rheinheimera sp. TaxID=1869214 RepID=UPI002FDD350A
MTEQNVSLPKKNRRHGPDWLLQSINWLSIAGWVVFVIAMGISHLAKPEVQFGFLQYLNIQVRDYWDPTLTARLIYLLWWCCGISLFSLFLNRFRLKRAEDHLSYNVVVLLLMSSAVLLYLAFIL